MSSDGSLGTDHRFDNQVLNISPQLIAVLATAIEKTQKVHYITVERIQAAAVVAGAEEWFSIGAAPTNLPCRYEQSTIASPRALLHRRSPWQSLARS
jgi:hypothetical protein